ncbi:hypothetical protein E0K83_03915 [Gramella sp. BOM4]|nr:hypothetical protein [Christiangramia bathymodioli]
MKDLLYLIVIAVAAYFIFQLNQELSGNKAAFKTLDDQLESQKEKYQEEIERIGETVDSLKKSSAKNLEQAERHQEEREQLKNDAYEKAPYRITDADSLAGLITRRAKAKR